MREKRLTKEASPCDTDFTDKSVQTVSDARAKGRVLCPNHAVCKEQNVRETIYCSRQIAQQFAVHVLDNSSPFYEAAREELHDLMNELPDGKCWVFRNEEWQVVDMSNNVINDIVQFALVIIDRQEGDRRPFTKDGMKVPEMGLRDAMHNAMLDLDDVYAEVGQKNPLR